MSDDVFITMAVTVGACLAGLLLSDDMRPGVWVTRMRWLAYSGALVGGYLVGVADGRGVAVRVGSAALMLLVVLAGHWRIRLIRKSGARLEREGQAVADALQAGTPSEISPGWRVAGVLAAAWILVVATALAYVISRSAPLAALVFCVVLALELLGWRAVRSAIEGRRR